MATDFHHGSRVSEVNEGTLPVRTVNSAVIGMLATGDDADPDIFPENEPVLITNVNGILGKAGDTGTLARSLERIAQQSKPYIIVVRVPEGETPEETTSNLIGGTTSGGRYTGSKALLTSKSRFNMQPRILGAPGLDSQEVTNALVSIAQQVRGFTYASCHDCETKEEAKTYRDQFGQRELMLIYPDFDSWNTSLSITENFSAIAYALGLRAKIDEQVGWHKTLSNMVVNGPTGISKDVFWDLQDPATDAGFLNQNDITTLINNGGYRFWGNRTAEKGGYFYFESYTRTAQIIADTFAEVMFYFIDVPLHPSVVKDMVAMINTKLRSYVTRKWLIGGEAWFDPAFNSKDELKDGKLTLDYDYTPVPPIENLMMQQRITDKYFVDFAKLVNA